VGHGLRSGIELGEGCEDGLVQTILVAFLPIPGCQYRTGPQSQLYAAVQASDQWHGRAIHPNSHKGMGLRQALQQLRGTN
jgi:hypothetical protein